MTRLVTLIGLAALTMATGLTQAAPRTKKLIEYGWDVPDPAYVRKNLREMERLPFEGLIFRLSVNSNVFTKDKWDETQFAKDFEDCENLRWEKFTDNFVLMLAASTMDWFSDEHWEAIRQHVGIIAKAAALARCRGICWDPEPYGDNPWQYSSQAQAKDKSFAEYEAKVHQRGAEFMQTIQEHLKKPVIHTFFQLSLFGHLLDEKDPEKRNQRLSQEGYGLLPAFLNGMLDAAGQGAIITDGNEPSYYYTSPKQYDDVKRMVKQRGVAMVAPENVGKYRKHVQMSQALYVDYLFGLGVWGQRSSPAPSLTPEERARWFEHNTYNALRTSDEFVWLYSEKMNWWTNTDLPPGLDQAVRSAKGKLAKHESLGFEVSDLLKKAKERRQQELRARLITRSAEIQRLAGSDARPAIDGKLDDAAWKSATSLESFVPYVAVGTKAKVETQAQVTYDDQNLYIALRCPEPKVGDMSLVGMRRDDSVWEGDSVDIFLARGETPTPYTHLILSPRNVQWDGLYTHKNLLDFNPTWKSATIVGDAAWTAEISVPWKEMKMKPPASGEKHRANLCRQRIPDGEQTSWSQMFDGFLESENFGTWVFR